MIVDDNVVRPLIDRIMGEEYGINRDIANVFNRILIMMRELENEIMELKGIDVAKPKYYTLTKEIVAEWAKNSIEPAPGCKVNAALLFKSFKAWCDSEGMITLLGINKFFDYFLELYNEKELTDLGVVFLNIKSRFQILKGVEQ
ncbi:MAG: hypothetical protein FWC06_08685 [Treponema sp.]|nr:hypothetical protein [Treponema sp.]